MNAPKLRVLHLLGELRPSGAETMLAVAAPLFAERGVAADVLSTGEVTGPFAEALLAAGYGVHHIPFAKSPVFFWRLLRFLRRDYDVLHIHTERATFWVGLTAWAAGVPVVLRSIHNTYAFTGNLRLRRMVQRHLLAWGGLRHISVGASVCDVEREHFGLETTVIRNWFDASRFTPTTPVERRDARNALGVPDGDQVVVTVGNCNAFKNHDALLGALAMLPHAERPLWLHAGFEEPGEPERAQASALGISDRVRFMGALRDVRVALRAADAFVMPSLREGAPISTIEALATGLPAVLTDVDGVRDFRGEFPGVVWSEPTAGSLAAALRTMFGPAGEHVRAAAAEHAAGARRRYDASAAVEAYVRIYRGSAGDGEP